MLRPPLGEKAATLRPQRQLLLVITVFVGDLAAEHVVAPEGITQNERDDKQGAHQHEALALRRCSGVPDRDRRRDDDVISTVLQYPYEVMFSEISLLPSHH